MNDWIDIPVVETMEYFGSVLATANKWAGKYAALIGLIGLLWSAFKLVNSRMTVKDLWWDTLFKWVGFILLMSLYPAITAGFSKIANEIGIKAGNGQSSIVENLKTLRNTLSEDINTQKAWANELSVELKTQFSDLDISNVKFTNEDIYSDYLDKLDEEIGMTKWSSKKNKKEAKKIVDEYRKKSKSTKMISGATLHAIKKVLIEEELDGSEGENLTNSYTKLNIWLKDANNNDSYYLSPSAILRIGLLNAQVMWEKENTRFYVRSEDIDNDPELNWFEKQMSQLALSFGHIWEMILCLFCCLTIIISSIFCIIQYTMTILEYTIVVGIGALFIPLALFDGTKDIPKKLIPVFTSFMVKMIVITICMMFVFYLQIENTIDCIADNGGMNLVTLATVFFNSIIAFMLTQNSPKIAQTILTGQPQLSMGEFVAGAGTAGAVAGGMAKAGSAVTKAGANTAINTAGNIHRGVQEAKSAASSASSGAKDLAKQSGFSDSQSKSIGAKAGFSAGVKGLAHGMIAKPAGEMASRIKNKAGGAISNYLHSKSNIVPPAVKKTLGMGGSSGGEGGGNGNKNPYENKSDGTYKGSFKDENGTKTNLTAKEFMDEKGKQGREEGAKIGSNTAINAVMKAEAKREKENKKLGDNLSGNKRQSGQS